MDNSSDIEVSEHENPFANAGVSKILAMQSARDDDRLASKKVWKQLDLTFRTPTTQRGAAIWINGFKAWVSMSRKRFAAFYPLSSYSPLIYLRSPDPNTGPDAELFIRFLDETLRRTTPRGHDKPAPSECTFNSGIFALTRYFEFTYPDWKLNGHSRSHISSWANQAVKEGRLIRGKWRQGRWVTFNIFLNLITSWFMDVFTSGCNSFDTVLSRTLPLALIVAVDCRVGETTQSVGWDVPVYMTLGDIELRLEDAAGHPNGRKQPSTTAFKDGDLDVSLVTAFIKIRYEKGEKLNVDCRTRTVLSLGDSAHNAIDVILLLLAHGLRHGLFKRGTQLQSVLLAASQRGDGIIEWKDPTLPVVPALGFAEDRNFCNIEKNASVRQPGDTVKQMAKIAGYLDHVTTHDLRRGCAKDIARIGKDNIFVSDAGTARALGHSNTETQRRFYNDQEDEPLNFLKPGITPGRIEARMHKAEEQYQKPNKVEMSKRISRFILGNPEKCLRQDAKFPVEWYVKPRRGRRRGACGPEHREWEKIRERAARYVLLHDFSEWQESHRGPADQRVSRPKPDFVPIGLGPGFTASKDAEQSENVVEHGDLDGSTLLDPALFLAAEQTTSSPWQESTLFLPETDIRKPSTIADDPSDTNVEPQLPSELEFDADFELNDWVIDDEDDEAGKETVDPLTVPNDTNLFDCLQQASSATVEDTEPNDICLDALELCFSSMEFTACGPVNIAEVPEYVELKPPAEYTPNEWVDLLATYNRVRNQTVPGGKFPTQKDFEGHTPMGNSRDPPSRHYFKCPDCEYFSHSIDKYTMHRQACETIQAKREDNQKKLIRKNGTKRIRQPRSDCKYPCTQPDCDKKFDNRLKREQHILVDHDFQVRGGCPLVEVCQTLDTFTTKTAFRRHLREKHDEDAFEPKPCPLADTLQAKLGCSTITFTHLYDYNEHIRNIHRLRGSEYSKLSLTLAEIRKDKGQPAKKIRTKSPERLEQPIDPVPCPLANTHRAVPGCRKIQFTLRTEHNRHLHDNHHLRGSEYQRMMLKGP
ncbi:hypothetical protein LTR41_011551 [Exophiala xenobiotica]|nr:hypothetical protein LTR41_011551 [Exophiala xenobiotica]